MIAFNKILCTLILQSVILVSLAKNDYSYSYFRISDSLMSVNNFSESIKHLLQAKGKFEIDENWEGVAWSLIRLAECNRELRDFDSAFNYLEQAETIGKNNNVSNKRLFASILYEKAIVFYYKPNPEPNKSIELLSDALSIRISILDPDSIKIADIYNWLGNNYNIWLQQLDTALHYYNLSLELRKKSFPETHIDIAKIYYRMGTVYRKKGDIKEALNYALEAHRLSKSVQYEEVFQANCNVVVANIYFNNLEFEQAINYYETAVDLIRDVEGNRSVRLILYFDNLGTAHNEIGNFQKAQYHFSEAARLIRTHNFQDTYRDSNNKFNFALLYLNLNDIDQSIKYLKEVLAIRKNVYGEKHVKTAATWHYLGYAYSENDETETALKYYQEALIAYSPTFKTRNILSNPNLNQVGNNYNLIYLLNEKSEDLLEKFKKTDSIKYLTGSLNTVFLADSMIQIYRRSYQHERSKLYLSKFTKELYEIGLNCLYELHQISDSDNYVFQALNFMENSKAQYLLETLQKAEEFANLGISDSIRQVELELKQQNEELEFLLTQENDDRFRDSIQNELFRNSQKQAQNIEFIMNENPNYINYRYHSKLPSLDETKIFQNNTYVVEYFWGDSALYTIGINDRSEQFHRIKMTDSLKSHIDDYLKEIRPKDSFRFSNNGLKEFIRSSYKVYKATLMTLLTNSAAENYKLLVIPDGPLAYLPFEALVSDSTYNSTVGFQALPYVIESHTVNYAYSLNHYMKSSPQESLKSRISVLAFAYSKTEDLDINDKTISYFRDLSYAELPFSYQEIKSIADYFNGDLYPGELATELNFKTLASNYPIVHLAMHGSSSLLNNSPRIIFRPDSVEDGMLFPYELYSLNLKNRLIVLSACETGVGQEYKGEGIYSMARAFAYAGCPTIVSSLWELYDRPTSKIMSNFYFELSRGTAVDESLQKAKLRFIEQADGFDSHPSNWAGLVTFGRTNSLHVNKASHWYLWLLGFVVLIFLLQKFYPRNFLIRKNS